MVKTYYWYVFEAIGTTRQLINSQSQVTESYDFDVWGNELASIVTYFVYDLGASETPGLAPLIAEYDANGNLIAKYHHDGGGLIAMSQDTQHYWYAFEAIGTVRQLTDIQSQVPDSYFYG